MIVDNTYCDIKNGNSVIEYTNTGYHATYSIYGATDNIPVAPALTPWVRPNLTSADKGSNQCVTKYPFGGDHFSAQMGSAWNDGDRAVYKAFDGFKDLIHPENQTSSNLDDWFACALMNSSNHWLAFYNPEPVMITKYKWYYTDVADDWFRIKKCDFQYSDDNSTWTTIVHSEFENVIWTAMNDHIEVNVENSGFHKYYRVNVTQMIGSGFSYSVGVLACRELELEGFIQG